MNIKVKYIVTQENPEFHSTQPFGSVPSVLVSEKRGIMVGISETYGISNHNRGPEKITAGIILTNNNKFELVALKDLTKLEEEQE